MKKRSTIVAGLAVLLSTVFFASNAQSTTPAIKVLPTNEEGVVKLLVVGTTEDEVDVKFYTDDGLVGSDAIKKVPAGFNKRYDVRQIMRSGFTMEITADGTSATYKLVKSKGKMIPYLSKTTTTYEYPVIASND